MVVLQGEINTVFIKLWCTHYLLTITDYVIIRIQ